MWQLGKHCPFRAGGETLELPVNRKKKGIFLINRAAVSSGGKCWVLRIDSVFAVSQLWAGSDPAPPWSLFIPSSPSPAETNPFKKRHNISVHPL